NLNKHTQQNNKVDTSFNSRTQPRCRIINKRNNLININGLLNKYKRTSSSSINSTTIMVTNHPLSKHF
ncbi:MAG: hypothetical protein QF377_05420, partial [Candidatus Thalassarchaeum sp.]|nr:hypothetical protein [Candidatus Thalassarchaeum sp.]